MSYTKSILVSVALLGTLCACAGKPETGPAPMVQGVQRIGVASVIGDSLEYRQIAMIAVGNETEMISTKGLSFDRFIKREIAKGLKGRYTLEDVKVSDGEKDPVIIAVSAASSRKPDRLDAYVVVVPALRDPWLVAQRNANVKEMGIMYGALGSLIGSAISGDSHDYSGLGLYRSPTGAFSYAVADLVLIDGHTYEELRRVPLLERSRFAEPEPVEGEKIMGNMRTIAGGDSWPDSFDEFSKAQKKEVSDSFSVLLRVAVARSLQQAGLTY